MKKLWLLALTLLGTGISLGCANDNDGLDQLMQTAVIPYRLKKYGVREALHVAGHKNHAPLVRHIIRNYPSSIKYPCDSSSYMRALEQSDAKTVKTILEHKQADPFKKLTDPYAPRTPEITGIIKAAQKKHLEKLIAQKIALEQHINELSQSQN